MPIVLTEINSPILEDKQQSFIGGQFSNAVPLLLNEDTLALLEDAESDTTGGVFSRRGTTQLGASFGSGAVTVLDYYNTTTANYPIAATASSGVYKYSGGVWTQLTAGTPPGNGVLSTAVGNAFLYAVTGSGVISKWNGSTWVSLATDSPPSNCSILLWDGFRLIASGQSSAPDAIYFSGILNDGLWASMTGGYQIQPGGGDGQAIIALKAWNNNNMAVFKRSSTWIVTADPKMNVSDMPIQSVHKRIGCIATNSAHQCGDDILFLANDLTVRSLNQTIASDDQWRLEQALSFPIQDIVKRINPNAASGAAGMFWKGRYLLAIPLDNSTTNNYIIVYNTITSKWSGGWTNLPVSYFAIRNDAGVDKLIMGLANSNGVIEFLDYIAEANATDTTYTDYNGNSVAFHFITRAMIFGDLDSQKKGLNVNMKLNKSKGPITITATFDEGLLSVTKTIDTGVQAVLTFPVNFPAFFPRLGVQPASMSLMPYPKFHQVQFEIKSISAGRKEVRALTAQAFPEATDLRGKFVAT